MTSLLNTKVTSAQYILSGSFALHCDKSSNRHGNFIRPLKNKNQGSIGHDYRTELAG